MENIDPGLAAGIVAALSVLVWLIDRFWVGVLGRQRPSKTALKVAVFIGAVALSAWQALSLGLVALPALPVFGGDLIGFALALLEFATALLAVATAIMKGAQVFYDFIWQRVLDWLDSGVSVVIGRAVRMFRSPSSA